MNEIPALHPKPPGLALRTFGLVVPGIRRVSAQIKPYTSWWNDQNQQALHRDGPLLVIIGDSTAIGIGASEPDRGYVGLVRNSLSERDDTDWRVINLAQSGSRVADGLTRQLPIVEQLSAAQGQPQQTICLIGTNDVVWSSNTTELRERLRLLIAGLPDNSLVGVVIGASSRAREANRAIRNAAGAHDLEVIDPWREPGPPPEQRLADDKFHPNDIGYLLMARSFARQLNAPEPSTG